MSHVARLAGALVVTLALTFPAGYALADSSWTFQPRPADLWDLPHNRYYTWGIDWTIPHNEYISSASIFIHNINNWIIEDGDILYIHLIDDLNPGVIRYTDHGGGGNNLAGLGIQLTTYSDTNEIGNYNPPEDWTYHFTSDQIATLTDYAADSRWGLGFDPDCHFFNDGIYLNVECTTIPEPGTWALMASALGIVGWVKRRRSSSAS